MFRSHRTQMRGLTSSNLRSEMLLNIIQCTEKKSLIENNALQNVKYSQFENIWHGSRKKSLQTQVVVKTMGCSLKTNSRTSLSRTTPTQVIVHGEVKQGPLWNIHSYILLSLVWKVICRLPEKKHQ